MDNNGELFDLELTIPKEKEKRYKSPKRLNMKIWVEALNWTRTTSCKSMLDVRIFDYITYSCDKSNEFREEQKAVAELLGTTPNTISRQIKRMLNIGLLHRKERGVYMMNPFVAISKKTRSSEEQVALQNYWTSIYGTTPTLESINKTSKLI